jgi:RHS repeat-associated protein
VPGPLATGPRLGYRGEVEFDGETWLRHRIYEPASRSLAQPDPLLPVPATASAANPYHYAANNPIGLSDPLGLRPVGDAELRAIRDRMGHNALQQLGDDLVDAGKAIATPIYNNAGVLAAGASGLALIPPLTPFMAPVAIGLGVTAAAHSREKHDYTGMAIDLVGIIPGVGGWARGLRAENQLQRATAEGRSSGWRSSSARRHRTAGLRRSAKPKRRPINCTLPASRTMPWRPASLPEARFAPQSGVIPNTRNPTRWSTTMTPHRNGSIQFG